MADTTIAEELPFPFFKLSIELRNWVYRNLVDEDEVAVIGGRAHELPTIYGRHFLDSRLRLVSREFKHEYEKETLRHAEVLVAALVYQPILDVLNRSRLGAADLMSLVQNVYLDFAVYEDEEDEGMDFSGEAVGVVQARVSALPALFPALRKVTVSLRSDIEVFEGWIVNGRFDPEEFFSLELPTLSPPYKDAAASREIEAKLELRLHATLWGVHRSLDRGLALGLMASPHNEIIYRAKPCSGPNSWHGLALETEKAGTFDYEAEVAAAQRSEVNPRPW